MALTGQAKIIADTLSDSSPIVYYSALIVLLHAVVDFHGI
jgi:hypothetical protein